MVQCEQACSELKNGTKICQNAHGLVNSGGDAAIVSSKKCVSVIGACVNEGQDWYNGVETAPTAFREAGLFEVIKSLSLTAEDEGDVHVDKSVKPLFGHDNKYYDSSDIKNGELVGETCGRLYERVFAASEKGNFVLTLGGDHSVAVGTISAIKQSKKDIGVIWVDAHADCNTPASSPSGNFHGMPLGMLLGWFEKKAENFGWIDEYLEDPVPEHRVAYIGLRDVDAGEKALLRNRNLLIYSMHDVERLGIATVLDEIIASFGPTCALHLSFDIDGIDPVFAPGTGTRSRGGLNYRESRYICTRLAATTRLESMDLVEVNPTIDEACPGDHGDNPNLSASATLTVKLGMDLIEFALGKTLT